MKNRELSLLQSWQYSLWHLTNRWFQYDRRVRLLPVDFDKPWYQLLWAQKGIFAVIFTIQLLNSAFFTTLPLLFTTILTNRHPSNLSLLAAVWAILNLGMFWGMYLYMQFSSQIQYGINYAAHRFFLTVDPIFHTTRSSGRIIAKIDRSVNAWDNILDLITFEIQFAVISFITAIGVLFSYHSSLGLLAAGIFVLLVTVSVTVKLFLSQGYEPFRILDDDAVKAASLENLQSIQLIRASFASTEMDRRLQDKNKKIMATNSNLWQNHVMMETILRLLYIASTILMAWQIWGLLRQGMIELAVAIGLMLTYLNGSREVIWIGGRASRFMQYYTQIDDLFRFIRRFGKQTFPVLETTVATPAIQTQVKQKQTDSITIALTDLHFDYGHQTQLFENHHLNLSVPRSLSPKLYGIIGPSGTGKTSLLSILGGQLKPSIGQVLINGIDMYSVADETRKFIVGLQMQTATNLRGSLRYNLLFGLPGNQPPIHSRDLSKHDPEYPLLKRLIDLERKVQKTTIIYSDRELIRVLNLVGLWHLFEKKKGLATLIGEGGLNLSGGQRQRLNFASLYLRSKYYKPEVIMIDEPTSSLDEISEQAITTMILELSDHALTLVIAHRLKTLKQAQAILDLSLLTQDKELNFYPKGELRKRSDYYQKLMAGEVEIEEAGVFN